MAPRRSLPYDEAAGPVDRGDALAASAGSANAIAFPSGSGTFIDAGVEIGYRDTGE